MRIGIQLYTLRDVGESLSDRIERVADTPFEGVQTAGFGEASPDDVAATLERTGLEVAGAHVGVADLEESYVDTVAAYRAIDCDQLVVSSYGTEAFETEEGARDAGRHLAELADRAADDGIDLHYHNHTYEFTDLGDETTYDVFAAAAEGVGLEIDTGLANAGGEDPVALLERYGDRVTFVHLTDSRANEWETRHSDLGEGDIDLQRCADVADDAGAEWVLFEHGLTDDPVASMEGAAAVMTDLVD